MPSMLISVIVATYNRPDALRLVIQSLLSQTDSNYEILIADDGSKQDTTDLVKLYQATSSIAIHHVWQTDDGFRLSRIRNLATKQARGEYLIFLDGDCIVQPDFVAQHRNLAKPQRMVTGSRILLEQKLTDSLCASQKWSFESFKSKAIHHRLHGQVNKILPYDDVSKLRDHMDEEENGKLTDDQIITACYGFREMLRKLRDENNAYCENE